MQQIKLFVDIESNVEAMEERINGWIKERGVKIVNIFGNIAPQTVTPATKAAGLAASSKFSSSDMFVAVVYETT